MSMANSKEEEQVQAPEWTTKEETEKTEEQKKEEAQEKIKTMLQEEIRDLYAKKEEIVL